MNLAPVLMPHGLLILDNAGWQTGDALALLPEQSSRLEQAFARGSGHGLLCLGADEVGTALPAILSYWRELAARNVSTVCALPQLRSRTCVQRAD
jgi:non-specific serine/threonine protein kinase